LILTASDDGNVRIWKSNSSAKLGPVSGKERSAIEYRQKLIEKWGASGDVRSVHDRRHVPGSIHNAVKLKRDMVEAAKVKEERRRKHTRAGREKPKAERKSELKFPPYWMELTVRRGHDCRAEVMVGIS
jgi:WD repeat and SOF domain-containing protein 1